MNTENKLIVFLRKFKFAFKGLYYSIKEEKTLVFHLIASALVLIVSGIINEYMQIIDWILVVIVISVVIGIELINTAIENVVDMVAFKFSFNARKIKDVSAAASLVFSLMATVVGLLIYIPKFIQIVESFQ